MDFKISLYYDELITAKQQLIVFKDLIPTTAVGKYLSYTRKFPYEEGFEYLEDSLVEGRQQNRLTHGFRCYTELGHAIGRAETYGGSVVYVKIPVGAKYYVNRLTCEICADAIIIEHSCWRSNTLKRTPFIQADFDKVPEWGVINTVIK